MEIITESVFMDVFKDDVLYEASETKTYTLRDTIYPLIDKVLSTPDGKVKFNRHVQDYVNRNSERLTTVGPMHLILFTQTDKQNYYDLFGIAEETVVQLINTTIKMINDKAKWQLIKQNPVFVILYYVIRYFTMNKDPKSLNNALVIMALAFYPSMYSKYFKFDPNPGVMQYTIDNLSQRFMIKKENHIFGTLIHSIQGSWKFHEKDFSDGCDTECIRFIQRIRNDQNSLMKKIANNYMENYRKGLTIYTQVDSYDDAIVVDNENDTNRVESIVNKVVMQMILNGVDLKLCDFASNASNVSKIDLRNYLTKITVEKNSDEMKAFIESILFIYLYDEKHTFEQINSKAFISFALALFKKTNSKNKNITNIKITLDKWGNMSGIYTKFNRLATRVDYTRAIFLYMILSIQKYN